MEAPAPSRKARRSAGRLTFTQSHHSARRARAQASIRRSSSYAYPAFWFSELDLDFGISGPAVIGKDIEDLIGTLPAETDPHSIVELWRLGARAYHLAKKLDDQHRCQSAAADQFVLMADHQPVAMMTSSMLARVRGFAAENADFEIF
jgi:hypothetical protein